MANLNKYLKYWAQIKPNAEAIRSNSNAITYLQLNALVSSIAFRLREVGLKPGQLSITCFSNKEVDWLMALAIHHVGGVSCSNHGNRAIQDSLEPSFVFTDSSVEVPDGTHLVRIDGNWFSVTGGDHLLVRPHSYADADLVRLILTSGTGAEAKAVPLTYEQLDGRSLSNAVMWLPYGDEFNFMPLSTAPGIYSAINTLQSGGTFYYAHTLDGTLGLIQQFRITHLYGSPNQFAPFLKFLEDSSTPKLDQIKLLRIVGGAISHRLLENLKNRICSNVVNYYGSTEVGAVCATPLNSFEIDSRVIGYITPQADVEIVDEEGHQLAIGTIGLIRIRSSNMANHYYKNDSASILSFRDGWFYPGDLGAFLPDGRVVLAGRQNELVNIGGVKIDPALVDPIILEFSGVSDAALFSLNNHLGASELCAALVVDKIENFDFQSLGRFLLEKAGPSRSPARFFLVDKIPRNEMGKVVRHELSRHFEGS